MASICCFNYDFWGLCALFVCGQKGVTKIKNLVFGDLIYCNYVIYPAHDNFCNILRHAETTLNERSFISSFFCLWLRLWNDLLTCSCLVVMSLIQVLYLWRCCNAPVLWVASVIDEKIQRIWPPVSHSSSNMRLLVKVQAPKLFYSVCLLYCKEKALCAIQL